MASIFWFADGGGTDRRTPPVLIRWIRSQSPALIVYGGDVYRKGTEAEFELFFEQFGRNMAGVPILNKIPFISRLFKNTGIGRETDSLMLLVTPRIIIQEEEEELLGIPAT